MIALYGLSGSFLMPLGTTVTQYSTHLIVQYLVIRHMDYNTVHRCQVLAMFHWGYILMHGMAPMYTEILLT